MRKSRKKLYPAIPTKYKGVSYQSRLEARWALFFENAGIKFMYEPRGPGQLPDFSFLDKSGEAYTIEVKGKLPNKDYIHLLWKRRVDFLGIGGFFRDSRPSLFFPRNGGKVMPVEFWKVFPFEESYRMATQYRFEYD